MLINLYKLIHRYLKIFNVLARAVASMGPGGRPPDKVLPPFDWPGAVYGEF